MSNPTISATLTALYNAMANTDDPAMKAELLKQAGALTGQTVNVPTPSTKPHIMNDSPKPSKVDPRTCTACGEKIKGRLPKNPKLAKLCGDCRTTASPAPSSNLRIETSSVPSVKAVGTPKVLPVEQVKAKREAAAKASEQSLLSRTPDIHRTTKLVGCFVRTPYGVKVEVTKAGGRFAGKMKGRHLGGALRAQFGKGYELITGDDVNPEDRGMYIPEDELSKAAEIVVQAATRPVLFESSKDGLVRTDYEFTWS